MVASSMAMAFNCAGLEQETQYNISVAAENDVGKGPASLQQATTTCYLNENDMMLHLGCDIK